MASPSSISPLFTAGPVTSESWLCCFEARSIIWHSWILFSVILFFLLLCPYLHGNNVFPPVVPCLFIQTSSFISSLFYLICFCADIHTSTAIFCLHCPLSQPSPRWNWPHYDRVLPVYGGLLQCHSSCSVGSFYWVSTFFHLNIPPSVLFPHL